MQDLDGQITRARALQAASAATAQPVADQEDVRVYAADEDPYTNEDAAKRRGLGTAKGLRAISARYSSHDFIGNPNVLTWLLGRPPTTFEEYVRQQYATFARSEATR